MKGEAKDGNKKMQLQIKQATSIEELCAGLPKPIYVYMKYIRSIKFHQKPDYAYLKELF